MVKPPQLDFETLFKAAAEIGYVAVEMWERRDTFEEELALARKHGLAMVSMIGHASLPDGLNKRSNHDRIEQELRESIDIAVEHGIPGLICFSGNRQPHQTEIEAIEAVAHGTMGKSKVVGHSIESIKLPPGISISAVVRGKKVMQAHHDTVIEENDHVILFMTDRRHIDEVERLFQVGLTFF